MGKLIKILLSIVVVVVLIVVIAGVIVTTVVDPNDYKDEIVKAVKQQTGRDLVINSQIETSFFPWLGASIGDVTLANREGFTQDKMIALKKASVYLKIMPIFSGNIEVDTVKISGVTVNLEAKKNGQTNWDDLAGSQDQPEKTSDDVKESTDSFVKNISIEGVELENVTVRFLDGVTGKETVLDNLNLKTGTIEPNEAIEIALDMALNISEQTKIQQSLKGHFEIRDDYAALSVPDLVAVTVVEDANLPKPITINNQLKFFVDLTADKADLDNLTITIGDVALKLEAKVTNLSSENVSFSASVDSNDIDLKKLLAEYHIAYEATDDKVLSLFNMAFQLSGTANSIKMDDLTIKIDDTTFDGNAVVKLSEPLNIYARLKGSEIDIDRYLPKKSDETASETPQSDTAPAPAQKAENPQLPDLIVDAEFAMKQVKVANMRTSNLLVALKGKDKKYHLSPVKADLYDGNVNAKLSIDGSGNEPKFTIEETLKNVQIGELLKDATGDDQLSGKANLNAKLTTKGWDVKQQKANLNGTSAFVFSDGAIKGFNIAHSIRQVKSALGKTQAEQPKGELKTDFSSLKGTAVIKNGVVNNKDFTAHSPLLRIKGDGSFSLPDNVIDYQLETTIVGSLEGQDAKDLKELKGVPIPVHITGTTDDIKVTPNMEKLLQAKATEQIQKKLEEKIGIKGADGLLKGLFK